MYIYDRKVIESRKDCKPGDVQIGDIIVEAVGENGEEFNIMRVRAISHDYSGEVAIGNFVKFNKKDIRWNHPVMDYKLWLKEQVGVYETMYMRLYGMLGVTAILTRREEPNFGWRHDYRIGDTVKIPVYAENEGGCRSWITIEGNISEINGQEMVVKFNKEGVIDKSINPLFRFVPEDEDIRFFIDNTRTEISYRVLADSDL